MSTSSGDMTTSSNEGETVSQSTMPIGLTQDLLATHTQDISKSLGELAAKLDAIGNLDRKTGKVQIDDAQLVQISQQFFSSPDSARSFVEGIRSIARDGVALFGTTEQIASGTGAVAPWVTIGSFIQNHLQSNQPIPKGLMDALGIDAKATPDPGSARKAILARFPNAPSYMLDTTVLQKLIDQAKSTPPASFVPLDSTPESVIQAAQCFINGPWSFSWWGWTDTLSHNCGTLIADTLFNGWVWLLAAAVGVILSGTVPPIAIVVGSIALYGIILAFEIAAVNGQNGVVLHGYWYPPEDIWATSRP